jgi:hypothetical protein
MPAHCTYCRIASRQWSKLDQLEIVPDLGAVEMGWLTDMGDVIVRCSVVIIFVQRHPYSIHTMQRMKNIESSNIP